ncbi:transmembrane protein 136-like [Trichoplusia ni]|uniref:Transmembrane protein 136-like n=1 Tax=Trichoplusia ni TaxID=7111 RepID=A0A7E5VY54_TRINI|nr:transmembrane protein 136-like [Trichoplusia ni]
MRHELSTGSLVKLLSFLFWNWVYFETVENSHDESPEWCSRVVALLHSSIATLAGLTQCKCRTFTWRLTRYILPCQYLLMVWSWGYFAFDLLWCLAYWTDSVMLLSHHTCALLAITRYMQKGHSGCTFACTLVLLEITNPLLQIRWFLKYHGYGKSKAYFAVEAAYLGLFLFLRGVVGTFLMIWIFGWSDFDWEEIFYSLTFYVISMIFVYDVVGYVRHKYKNEIVDCKGYYYATCLPDDMVIKGPGTSRKYGTPLKDELDKAHIC